MGLNYRKSNQMSEEERWYCYCLQSTKGSTYVGATVDPDRRLRQHCGELVGGARATRSKVAQGETWTRIGLVGPFEKIAALQFEWRWKFLSRKLKSGTPIQKRKAALEKLLAEKEYTVTLTWNDGDEHEIS